jgi:hypothetical protein
MQTEMRDFPVVHLIYRFVLKKKKKQKHNYSLYEAAVSQKP